MNNPIIVPMTISSSDTNLPMTVSNDDTTLAFSMDASVIVSPVRGVKGSAETEYRTGLVSLSPADIGVDTSSFATRDELPTATSDLVNDSGFITGSQVPANEEDPSVPSWAKQANKPTYTASEVHALPDTTIIPTVPTNVSAFTNDAGYLTLSTLPVWDGSIT